KRHSLDELQLVVAERDSVVRVGCIANRPTERRRKQIRAHILAGGGCAHWHHSHNFSLPHDKIWCGGYRRLKEEQEGNHLVLTARCMSRSSSRFFSSARLSHIFLPRPSPSATFTLPRLK